MNCTSWALQACAEVCACDRMPRERLDDDKFEISHHSKETDPNHNPNPKPKPKQTQP